MMEVGSDLIEPKIPMFTIVDAKIWEMCKLRGTAISSG